MADLDGQWRNRRPADQQCRLRPDRPLRRARREARAADDRPQRRRADRPVPRGRCRQMIERKSGAILNVASTAAFQPGPKWRSISRPRRSCCRFSEALHEELKPHGIKVSCLCPGPTRTEFGDVAGLRRQRPVRPGRDGRRERSSQRASTGSTRTARWSSPGWLNKLGAASTRFAPRAGRPQDRRSDQILNHARAAHQFDARIERERGAKMAETDTIDRATSRKVQVASLPPADSGRGFARLPDTLMDALGLAEGDVIEIVGKRSTAARAIRPYGEDEGIDIIRLDGLQRANAGVGSGDFVEVRKAAVQARDPGRLRAGPAQHPAAGLGRGAEAHLRRAAAGRRRHRRHRRPPAGQRRHARPHPADAQRARPSRCRSCGWSWSRPRPRASSTSTPRPRSSCCPNIPPRTASAAPTSPMTISAGCATRSTRCARWSSCRCATPSCSSGSASIRPRASCSTARPAPARPCWRARSPTKAPRNSSTSTAPRSWARPMARASGGCAKFSRQAAQAAPSIIFIDEIDSIAPKRGQVTGEAEKRLVAQLLTLLDGIEPRQNTVVIAATNRPEAIDEALRRPGRFDREIVVGVPDEPGRREILGIHTRGMPLAPDVNLDDLARRTYGFVGADLAALTREAALEAVRRIMPKLNLAEATIPTEMLDALSVELQRLRQCAEARPALGDARGDGRSADDHAGTISAASTRPRDRLREGVELPLEAPRGVPPARHPPGQGLPALRPAGHRQDLARQGRGAREPGQFHRHQIVRPAQQMVRRERAADRAAVRPRAPGRADDHLHRRARQPGAGARRRPRRAAGHRARGQHHPRRDGRARGAAERGRDRRDQPPDPDRSGAAPPGPLRRADLCRHAGYRRTPADPRHPHPQHAACRRCRPREDRAADRALHRRRPRGSGAPRRPHRASPRARRGQGDDGGFRSGAGRDPGLGHARDARGI